MELVMVMRLAGRAGMKNSCPMLHPPHPTSPCSCPTPLVCFYFGGRGKSLQEAVFIVIYVIGHKIISSTTLRCKTSAAGGIPDSTDALTPGITEMNYVVHSNTHLIQVRSRYMTVIYYSADKQTLQLLTNFNNRSEKTYLSTCSRYHTRIPS